jgi:hypothetical protein
MADLGHRPTIQLSDTELVPLHTDFDRLLACIMQRI